MSSEKAKHLSDAREEFIRKHGIDVFLIAQKCFQVAPLQDPSLTMFVDDIVKVLYAKFASNLLPSPSHLKFILVECKSFPNFSYEPDKGIFLLPPCYDTCPVGCIDESGQPQTMTAVSHAPPHDMIYELSGTCRVALVLKRNCRTCGCVLQYDMVYCKKKYQFYRERRPYVRITPNCYFSRPLCAHIVRTLSRGRSTFESFAELFREGHELKVFSRKWVSTAFYRHEVEEEIRSRNLLSYPFSSYNKFDEILPVMEHMYSSSGFPHTQSARCLLYKCKWFLVGDGIWSINFPHCAAPMQTEVAGFPHINLPPVCPMQPASGKVYCAHHSELAKLSGHPVTKNQMEDIRQLATVDQIQQIFNTPELKSLLEAMQKTSGESLSFDESFQYRCKKNLGTRGGPSSGELKAHIPATIVFPAKAPRSRGYLLVSRPCGQIVSAVPIFKSESPSQVFLTMLAALYRTVTENNIPVEDWKKVFILYDNVCNLDRIRTANNLLPLPSPFDRLWLNVNKAIDVFHLSNHIRPECKTTYNPNRITKVHPDLKKRNTEVAEQNFSWLRQYKTVLNSIPRNRQLFYLYRLIVHRNAYLSKDKAAIM